MSNQPALADRGFARPASPSAARRAVRAIWADFPVWFVFAGTFWLNHLAIAIIDPSLYAGTGSTVVAYALTAIVPAAWVALYFVLRLRAGGSLHRGPRGAALVSAAVLAPLLIDWAAMALVPTWRLAPTSDTLLAGFEIIQFCSFLALAAHAYFTRGAASAVTFFAVALLYGVMLENTGIMLGFFSEHGYHVYVPGLHAPLATMLGWAIIAYCGVWTAERLDEFAPRLLGTPLRLALVATAFAVSVDVQLDPIASLAGLYWRWHRLLPTWFLSVPFCNFAAWLGAYLPFAWACFAFKTRSDLSHAQRNWRLLALLPVLSTSGGLVWLGLMTIAEGGFSGPTYRILGEFFSAILRR